MSETTQDGIDAATVEALRLASADALADRAAWRPLGTRRDLAQLADARARSALAQTGRRECEKICAELRGMLADAKDRADRAETGNAQMTADLAAAREYAETLAGELEVLRKREIDRSLRGMEIDRAAVMGMVYREIWTPTLPGKGLLDQISAAVERMAEDGTLWVRHPDGEPGPDYRGIDHETRFEPPPRVREYAEASEYAERMAAKWSACARVDDTGADYPEAVVKEFLTTAEAAAHPLYPVLAGAIDQCMRGKGRRHGGCETPFMDQSWRELARVHGRGFLTGQAGKKLAEAVRRGLIGEPFEREALGAIVYIGMSILLDREMCAEGGAE